MKILILSPRFPNPLGKADSMTVFRLIQYLSQRHDVYLVCFYENTNELKGLADLKQYCQDVRYVKLKKWKSITNMLMHGLTKLPLQVAYYRDRLMQQAVNEMVAQHKPDLAYAHLIRMAEHLKNKSELKRVLALQISQTLNYRRMIDRINVFYYRVLYNIEYRKVRHYEPMIMQHFDSCLLISKNDKESLDGHKNIRNVFYSPHGVDVEFYSTSQVEECEKENAILFCGVLETPTNIDAILYFYKEIFPIVKESIPDLHLYLAGKNPAKVIKQIAEKDESVTVTGYLDDVRPFYVKAKVGIAPMRIGAGLQNKLLIGMSMKLPMVCTSVANEGIGAMPKRHLLIDDDPKSFAESVVNLMRNEKQRTEIGHSARSFVEEKWTWEYYFKQLENHFMKIAKFE